MMTDEVLIKKHIDEKLAEFKKTTFKKEPSGEILNWIDIIFQAGYLANPGSIAKGSIEPKPKKGGWFR